MGEAEVRPFESPASGEPAVRGYLHIPQHASGDGLVLTHGAGADCQLPLLVALAAAFSNSGFTVLRCDLPFRQQRPQGPPPRGSAERDQQGLRNAVEAMKQEVGRRVFLGGHSYGGRQGSMLAASDPGVTDALLLLSYPLHPPKNPAEPRTVHFPNLRTSTLFVHGTRDGFGSIEEMQAAISQIPARVDLFPIEDAGHELMTPRNHDNLPRVIVERFKAMLRGMGS
jgi:predicted alpha/beta-hydrolase family hydrolase